MASDLLQIGGVTGLTENSAGLDDNLSTGDLRRRYNFGDKVSELAIAQDPFFRLVSKVNKKPTDDPQFKFTERRPSYHKRYAYVMGHSKNGTPTYDDAELFQHDANAAASAAGQTVKVYMVTDYKSAGNLSNVQGQTGSSKIDVGASGTRPAFFLPGQLVRIPVTATTGGGATAVGYHIMKVDTVTDSLSKDSKECVKLSGKIVKFDSAGNELASFHTNNFGPGGAAGDEEIYDRNIATQLEPLRSYVVGTAHAQGSGYPDSWKDQPFSSAVGLTQIFKTAMAMDNTTRATVLKYEPNEFARIWRTKLIEHKFDIEQALLLNPNLENFDDISTGPSANSPLINSS